MAIYDQPKDVDTRVRFFDGQFLVDQDFVDEQKYHLDRERRLGRMLRITGIVDGLAVSAAQSNKVTIAPGTAIDSDGRQIVLAKERTLDLPAAAFNNKSAIKLYIIYRELATEKAKVGSESERRWHENPLIAAVAPDGTSTDTWDSTLTPVLLAQLSLSNNGAVAVDSSVAPQYAGLSLRGSVGIGTTNPGDYRLNVTGSSRLGGATDYGSNTVLSVAPGTIQFDAPGVPGGRLIVNGSNGNVGIGTANPDSKLTINANIVHDNNYSTYGDAPLTVFEPNHNGGSAPNGTRDILNLVREGVNAQAFGNKVSLAVGRYEHNATNSRTQLDIKLTDGSFNSHTTVMSLRSNGNVGIGTTSPAAKLAVVGGAIMPASGNSEAAGIMFPKDAFGGSGDSAYIRYYAREGEKTTFEIGTTSDADDHIALMASGNVGIGTTTPAAKLDVYAGSTTAGGWYEAIRLSRSDHSAITHPGGGLLFGLHSDRNFYFADIRDGTFQKYVMQIEADTGNVGIGTTTPRTALDTGTGVMSGAPNDYQKAQFTMSGGGTVTWGGRGGRLKWTARFIAISMESGKSFTAGHVNINQPTAPIPAANVYDGAARAADASGVTLNDWEALYAVHTVGGDYSAVSSFQIRRYTHAFSAPSNWLLVAVVNGDDNTVKLGTGVILSANSSSTQGSPLPTGTIIMWSGAINQIPSGWALCNGANGTPNLQDRFIVAAGSGYQVGATGGANEVALTVAQMPSHNHQNGQWRYLSMIGSNTYGGGGLDTSIYEPNLLNVQEIQPAGGNQAHENRPPFYALAFIMKL